VALRLGVACNTSAAFNPTSEELRGGRSVDAKPLTPGAGGGRGVHISLPLVVIFSGDRFCAPKASRGGRIATAAGDCKR